MRANSINRFLKTLALLAQISCRDRDFDAEKVEVSDEAKTVYTTIKIGSKVGVLEEDFDPERTEKTVHEFEQIRTKTVYEQQNWALQFVNESNAAKRRVLYLLAPEDEWILPALSMILQEKYKDTRAQKIQADVAYVIITRFPSLADESCESVLVRESHPAAFLCAEFFALKNALDGKKAEKIFGQICGEMGTDSFGFLSSQRLIEPHDPNNPRVVFHVCKGSSAMQAGLQKGDIIEKVDGVKMNSDESYGVLQDKSRRSIVLGVSRGSTSLAISLERK